MKRTLFFVVIFFLVFTLTSFYVKPDCEYYKVSFKNYTKFEMNVGVRYCPSGVGDGHSFVTKAWFSIMPGEKKLLINTKNATFYYYAYFTHRDDKSSNYLGNHRVEVYGDTYNFIEKDCRNMNPHEDEPGSSGCYINFGMGSPSSN